MIRWKPQFIIIIISPMTVPDEYSEVISFGFEIWLLGFTGLPTPGFRLFFPTPSHVCVLHKHIRILRLSWLTKAQKRSRFPFDLRRFKGSAFRPHSDTQHQQGYNLLNALASIFLLPQDNVCIESILQLIRLPLPSWSSKQTKCLFIVLFAKFPDRWLMTLPPNNWFDFLMKFIPPILPP